MMALVTLTPVRPNKPDDCCGILHTTPTYPSRKGYFRSDSISTPRFASTRSILVMTPIVLSPRGSTLRLDLRAVELARVHIGGRDGKDDVGRLDVLVAQVGNFLLQFSRLVFAHHLDISR